MQGSREISVFLVLVACRGCSQPLASQTFLVPDTSIVALPPILYTGFCVCSPLPRYHQVCAPPCGQGPSLHHLQPWASAWRWPRAAIGPGGCLPRLVITASDPRSHVQRRKLAEFWYRCCSWCCESGRRAAHPLTRLFHDTRVASYPSSPGEPRGTGADVDVGMGRGLVWG